MRQPLVFAILLVLFGALGWSIARRHGVVAANAAVERHAGAPRPDASSAGATTAVSLFKPPPTSTRSAAHDIAPAPPKPMRPLRVVGASWDLLAPAIAGNGSAKPVTEGSFASRGIELSLSVADRAGIERALSRGSGDAEGADLAIAPLPTFVQSYSRLRALQPEIVWVVGTSRGREALAGIKPALLTDPPLAGDVALVAPLEPAEPLFLALFMLDLAGVAPSRVKLVVPGAPGSVSAPLAAVAQGSENAKSMLEGRRLLLSTADATRLIPFVVIAPHGWAVGHADLLGTFAEAWQDGVERLAADAPRAARLIAGEKEGPDPVAMLERFGQIEHASGADNAYFFGLTPKAEVTLDALFRRTWAIWRSAGEIATPSPAESPVSTLLAERLAKNGAPRPPAPVKAAPGEVRVLVSQHLPAKADEAALVQALGFLSGLFERSPFRVAAKWDPRHLKAVIEGSAAGGGRGVVQPTVPPTKWSAVIEVLAGS